MVAWSSNPAKTATKMKCSGTLNLWSPQPPLVHKLSVLASYHHLNQTKASNINSLSTQAKRFEATSFTEDLSNLADLIYSEMQQFQQDKENLETELLQVGLNWSIFENLFAMRRLAEHAESVKISRGFLDDALGK